MILVDTSVWIDHLKTGDEALSTYLDQGEVLSHPFVIGELACGNLRYRKQVLTLLQQLPQITQASNAEVLYFIEHNNLAGKGIGYIDAHLLASVVLTGVDKIWTRNKRLHNTAEALGLAAPSPPTNNRVHEPGLEVIQAAWS